jgi:hypothetical protein
MAPVVVSWKMNFTPSSLAVCQKMSRLAWLQGKSPGGVGGRATIFMPVFCTAQRISAAACSG